MQHFTPADLAVLALELVPAAVFGFAGERVAQAAALWPRPVRIGLPVVCAAPYILIAVCHGMFSLSWLALYAILPVAIAWLLAQAAAADPEQRGNWRDAIILLTLGLPVDLRWFEPAWPSGLSGLGKLLLVDAGLYGFIVIRQLRGMGFDFHSRWTDWKTGLRELAFFAPLVIGLGLAMGFIHPHANAPRPSMILTWIYIFVFIAVPEELYFRAWVQNLLEARLTSLMGARARTDASLGAVPVAASRTAQRLALVITSVLFGLSHFNKRSAHFNWRYVVLATLAGIFYGRAWRKKRRVPASAITHASVDAIWTLWF
jgi:membrane protease YdiL (CAAX protease family)